MGATRTAAREEALGRTRQKMNIDFFRVEDLAGGRLGFRNALREALRARGRNRSCIVWGEPVGLFEGHEDGNLIEGEVGRIRMTDTPSIGSRECVLEEIELDDDQGIAERTAFLYDSGRGVLALHVRREAVSASRLCAYCDVFARNRAETFTLLPILRDDVQEQLRSMNVIKKVDVKFSRAAQATLVDADQSTRSFVRALTNLNGSTISVTVASGAGAENRLSFQGASDLIRNAFRQPVLVVLKAPFLASSRTYILQGYSTLLPAALNISAIAVGFLATSQSILLSLSRSRAVRLMKESGHYKRLLTFLRRAITTSFLWAILTAWLSTLHLLLGGAWRLGAVCVWTYLCACSILCYYRATAIMTAVMEDEGQSVQTQSAPEWKAAEDLTS